MALLALGLGPPLVYHILYVYSNKEISSIFG